MEAMLTWSWRVERSLCSGSGSEKVLQALLSEVVKAVMWRHDADAS
jgi:hypothetical protein